ncbi:MAG: hypothetical protein V4808_03755 [Pseudomonadota bacterium]
MIFSIAAILMVPGVDAPFTADQWAECAQIALFYSESATGTAQDELLDEASDFFEKAGALRFPGKTLGDAEYELLSELGQKRLAAQVARGKTAGAAQYPNGTLTICRLEKLRSID